MDGKIGVIPTDTIYGIVTSAFDEKLVEKIYKLRKRADDKPFIVLIGSTEDLKKFGVQLTDKQKEFLQNHWPNPLSVVLPVLDEKFAYLHRGKKSLETIDEAKEYFGNFVDFYIDRGRIISTPSTLIELSDDGSVKILREGSYKVEV